MKIILYKLYDFLFNIINSKIIFTNTYHYSIIRSDIFPYLLYQFFAIMNIRFLFSRSTYIIPGYISAYLLLKISEMMYFYRKNTKLQTLIQNKHTLLIGAHTKLIKALSAALCTSASARISHSAAANKRLIAIVIDISGISILSHSNSITLGTTEQIAITSRHDRTVSALEVCCMCTLWKITHV